ncbi:MAG: putative peptidoglycan glycosyltransferase FtsW [Gemmatimonadota bacterium]|nr:cell division protein FtsW [Gemmatimonadota bacterium]
MAPREDIAPANPVRFVETGLGRGWEPAAILGVTLVLLSFGLVTLYGTSSLMAQRMGLPDYHFALQQIMAAALGLTALVVCARMPYGWWRHLAWPLLLVTWVLLLLCILPGTEAIAPRINGARRWIRLGVSIQPSEVAMFVLIVWTAGLAVRKQEHFRSFSRGLMPFLVVWGAMVVPVVLEPNLSTSALMLMASGLVVFAAGGRIGHFVLLGLALLPALIAQLRVDFRADRLQAFMNLSADPAGAGYQVRQSLVALGSGGLTGVGFAEGRQKFGFLPEPHTDFMFSVIGEEWGFAGVTVLVLLYLTLVLFGFRVARRAPDLFGELLAVGLTSLIALHAILHMAVGLGLVPSTGLPLPLISYGKSNLVITLAAIGVLMSIARGNAWSRA